MRLDRNDVEKYGLKTSGKYALVKMRRLKQLAEQTPDSWFRTAKAALAMLEEIGVIEYGDKGTKGEFFVLKLRDRCAAAALNAYASECMWHPVGQDNDGRAHTASMTEYARDVRELASRAGHLSPFCKEPD